MEVSTSEFFIPAIEKAVDQGGFESKSVLWVLYADQIPPHIGISFGEFYFSLKANGKDSSVPVSNIIEIIERKKIKTVCFELRTEINIHKLVAVFEKYKTTIPYITTCLNPVKDVLAIENSEKLTELLDNLYKQNEIVRTFGYNMDSNFKGIKDYNVAEIHERLNSLKND